MTRDVYQCVDRMITVNFHLSARAGFPFKRLRPMHSGSDSDSFDEGGLTARGRKSKKKSGARASEKGKQKAKDVRIPMSFLTP